MKNSPLTHQPAKQTPLDFLAPRISLDEAVRRARGTARLRLVKGSGIRDPDAEIVVDTFYRYCSGELDDSPEFILKAENRDEALTIRRVEQATRVIHELWLGSDLEPDGWEWGPLRDGEIFQLVTQAVSGGGTFRAVVERVVAAVKERLTWESLLTEGEAVAEEYLVRTLPPYELVRLLRHNDSRVQSVILRALGIPCPPPGEGGVIEATLPDLLSHDSREVREWVIAHIGTQVPIGPR